MSCIFQQSVPYLSQLWGSFEQIFESNDEGNISQYYPRHLIQKSAQKNPKIDEPLIMQEV